MGIGADVLRVGDGRVPRVIGLGEPTHGDERFPRLRNALVRDLVEHAGLRTVALESSAWAGRVADAWVRGGPGRIDDVLDRGVTHGFGGLAANRELLEWARRHNDGRPAADRVRVTGFDPPIEMTAADAPRAALGHLHGYLAEHADVPCPWAEIDALLGPDGPWTDEAAAWDPARSVGSSGRVRELRVIADDLARTLAVEAPALLRATGQDAVDDAALAARCASGLLAYHAAMATTGDGGRRWSRLAGLRAVMMADNLTALAARGPTLAFAHTIHLRTGPATMAMGPMTVRWEPTGARLATRFGPDYRAVAGVLDPAGHPGPDGPRVLTPEQVRADGAHVDPLDDVDAVLVLGDTPT